MLPVVLLIVGTLTKQVLGGLHNLDRNATYLSSQADDRKSGSSIDDTCEQQAQELPARLCSQKPGTEEAGPLTVRQLQITKTDPGLVGGEISLQSSLVTTKQSSRVHSWQAFCTRQQKCSAVVLADAILEVVCSTFDVESACVAVNESHEKAFFWAGRGICPTGNHSIWAQQFTNWVLSANNHEIAIVEDASTNAR